MSDQTDNELSEDALIALLEAMPRESAPPDLALRMNAAYARATAPSWVPGAAFAGFGALLLLLATLLLSSSLADVITMLSAWAVAVRALLQVGLEVGLTALSRPSGIGLLAGQAVMLIAGIGILARLMRMTAPQAEGQRA